MKKISLTIFLFVIIFSSIYGHQDDDLEKAIQMIIIRETARGIGFEQKSISLFFIENIIIERINDIEVITEIIEILEFLYIDAINNYYDVEEFIQIRQRIVACLGNIGSEETINILIFVVQNDNNITIVNMAEKIIFQIEKR